MAKVLKQPQNPLILRCHRLMEAFAKSDDERDFMLDRSEGFIVYIDLDKQESDLQELYGELKGSKERYVLIPKFTFYEIKKIMEGFINEKVYDIDTKEKMLEIIQSKEARENFLEFLYDHHAEMEKWQQYYQERSRIRIIEWLRANQFDFVFEEDLDVARDLIEKVKMNLFEPKVAKDIESARKAIQAKAKTYYSSEALNPRPKRGRPPKQVAKTEIEPQVSMDIYTTVPSSVRPFLFTPDTLSSHGLSFSTKFENEEQLLARKRKGEGTDYALSVESLNAKLSELRNLSSRWLKDETARTQEPEEEYMDDVSTFTNYEEDEDLEDIEEEEDEDAEELVLPIKKKPAAKAPPPRRPKKAPVKAPPPKKGVKPPPPPPKSKPKPKPTPKPVVKKKAPPPPPPKKGKPPLKKGKR